MKKFLVILILPLIVGAGCTKTVVVAPLVKAQPAVTENTAIVPVANQALWPLSFTLPSGWIMTEGCLTQAGERVDCGAFILDIDNPSMLPQNDKTIDATSTRVYLQNTSKLALFGGIGPNKEVSSYYQSKGVAQITITRLSTPVSVPPTYGTLTEDLGNGFYKVVVCEKNSDCQIYGQAYYEYIFVGKNGEQYQFDLISQGPTEAEMKSIVLSAKEND